jgi:hypothetical protein
MAFIASFSVLSKMPDSDEFSVYFHVLLCRNFVFAHSQKIRIMMYTLRLELLSVSGVRDQLFLTWSAE